MRIKNILLILLLPSLAACVTVNEHQTDNVKASAINVQLGIGYMRQDNMEQANAKLSKAIRQDPDSASAHNAYAILQERLLQKDKAEEHYRRATELDRDNSEAANNYGAFLCRHKREAESEKYFLKALENPLYKTPEYAYTNAALCLIRIDQQDRAKDYLTRALAARSNFSTALVAMARINYAEQNFSKAKLYIDRYRLVAEPTAGSLWLAIRIKLEMDGNRDVSELAQQLETKFPDSDEYKSWLKIQ
ncbi:MAG: type IV pilus biogenesis/stability protein PilW [Gammaproteobacteria bacterium]|nr:type IV pilus biogenesis/stability protein PilW [Gammaproteobacteria bacterium]